MDPMLLFNIFFLYHR